MFDRVRPVRPSTSIPRSPVFLPLFLLYDNLVGQVGQVGQVGENKGSGERPTCGVVGQGWPETREARKRHAGAFLVPGEGLVARMPGGASEAILARMGAV